MATRIKTHDLLQRIEALDQRLTKLEQEPNFKVPDISEIANVSAKSSPRDNASLGGAVNPVLHMAAPPIHSQQYNQPYGQPYGYQQQHPYGQQQTGTLYDNYLVRMLLIYMPMDWQIFVTNLLLGLGPMKMWRAIMIVVATLSICMMLGIISVPTAILTRVQSFWSSSVCNVSTSVIAPPNPPSTYQPVTQ